MTNPDIQRAHLEHFAFLLRASRYRKFNAKVRLSKLNIVRRLLFAMHSSWYPLETVPHIVNALSVVMQAYFSANDAIKPVASYIAANATSGMCNVISADRDTIDEMTLQMLSRYLPRGLPSSVATTTTRKRVSF